MDDEQLHDLVRDTLRERAGVADTSVAAEARVAARRSHRTASTVGGAALAVAATVIAVALFGGPADRPDAEPPVAEETELPGPDPAAWRTEYWHDVQVEVPADWWYGGGLLRSAGDSVACFPEPMVSPAGRRVFSGAPSAPGYVGRPIYVTDVCEKYPFRDQPGQPYVWFDAPLELGTVDLGAGWEQETVNVNGSRITVATDDPALRQRILSSATGGETCLSNRDDLGLPWREVAPTEGDGATVCAYRADRGESWLSYAAVLDARPALDFVEAFESAPEDLDGSIQMCDSGPPEFEWVVITVDATAYVVHTNFMGCSFVRTPERSARLTPELVAPWATGGIPAVVYGPTGGKGGMIDGFIGPQG